MRQGHRVLVWLTAAALCACAPKRSGDGAPLPASRGQAARDSEKNNAQDDTPISANDNARDNHRGNGMTPKDKAGSNPDPISNPVTKPITKTDEQWRAQLTPEQYNVMRQKGTERAFSGALWNEHRKGVYKCAACGQDLFLSDTKFESGTGWPSFYAPAATKDVSTEEDIAYGMRRVEVKCSRCGSHLGHVFEDGPRPTGLRYCINSAALQFEEKK